MLQAGHYWMADRKCGGVSLLHPHEILARGVLGLFAWHDAVELMADRKERVLRIARVHLAELGELALDGGRDGGFHRCTADPASEWRSITSVVVWEMRSRVVAAARRAG